MPEGDRKQEVAGLDGLPPSLLDDLGGTTKPRSGLGHLAAERETQSRPEGRSGSAFEVACFRADSEPAHACLLGDVIAADEMCRDCEQLEPVEVERRLAVGRHQQLDGG